MAELVMPSAEPVQVATSAAKHGRRGRGKTTGHTDVFAGLLSKAVPANHKTAEQQPNTKARTATAEGHKTTEEAGERQHGKRRSSQAEQAITAAASPHLPNLAHHGLLPQPAQRHPAPGTPRPEAPARATAAVETTRVAASVLIAHDASAAHIGQQIKHAVRAADSALDQPAIAQPRPQSARPAAERSSADAGADRRPEQRPAAAAPATAASQPAARAAESSTAPAATIAAARDSADVRAPVKAKPVEQPTVAPAAADLSVLAAKSQPLSAPALAQPATPASQVAVLIERAVADRRTTAELTLTPDNLGQIQVQIRLDDSGALNATVLASQDNTAALLADGASQLRDALESAGLNVAGLDVRAQADSRRDQQAHPDAQTRAVSSVAAAGDADDQSLHAAAGADPVKARISGGSNLDLLA